MKTYAHFTHNGIEQLGSDAWYQLDGRNTLTTQIKDARARLHSLRHVQTYNGFQIRKGTKPSTTTTILQTSFL